MEISRVTVTFLSNATADDYDYLISLPEPHLGLMQRCFHVRADTLPAIYGELVTTLLYFNRRPVPGVFPNHALSEHDRDRILPPRLATATSRVQGHATVHTFYVVSSATRFQHFHEAAIFAEHKKPSRKFGDPLWVMPCCSSLKIHAHQTATRAARPNTIVPKGARAATFIA